MSATAAEPVRIDPALAQLREIPPGPPIEGHLVATTRAAEALHQSANNILVLLEVAARNSSVVQAEMGRAQEALNKAWNSYAAYDAVRTCEGVA